ncbi:MAG: sulfatase-like hydrolase/transferase [Alphaproteobacteria bacterium]|jgi:choline-sulfatase
MKPANLLFIMSDEHDPRHMGCYGSATVQTPNLDRLAARGTRFTSAYTSCPICVPARASWATGQYVHRIRYWDNAMGYDGAVPGWGHQLQRNGNRVESIGKLHYRNADDPTGFDKQTDPMHIFEGIGQVWGSIRDPLPTTRTHKMIKEVGAGVSSYNRYDAAVADSAVEWLTEAAAEPSDKPFVLYLGFVAPHFPFIVPQEFYDLYPLDDIPLPTKLHPSTGAVRHPWMEEQAVYAQNDEPLNDEQRRSCIAAYYGLCTYLDHHIGRVLDVLDQTGLSENTRVVYTSDHGENLGVRGTWGKSNMYQEATNIPLILAGPDVPQGKVCNTAANFVDYYPTILDAVGAESNQDADGLPGGSLWSVATAPDDPERTSFSEYHAVGAPSGAFMLRRGHYKFHYYVGFPCELYDLAADPEETVDLAQDPNHAGVVQAMETALRDIVDPEQADSQARSDQAALVERFGGRDHALGLGTPGATPPPGAAKHE